MELAKQSFLEEGNSRARFGKKAQNLCHRGCVCEFRLIGDCVHWLYSQCVVQWPFSSSGKIHKQLQGSK